MGFDSNQQPKVQKPIPPQGLQLAMCYSIINVGTHDEVFPGKPPVSANKVHFSWEFPALPQVVFDPAKGPQPMAVFQEYTVAAGDKAKLPKMLCSWGNMPKITAISSQLLKAFLGQICSLQMVHVASKTQRDSKTNFPLMYANVGLAGLAVFNKQKDATTPVKTINECLFLDLDDFKWEVFNKIPTYLQKKIRDSKEWSGILIKHPEPAQVAQPQGTTAYTPPYTAPTDTHVINGVIYNSVGQAIGTAPAISPNTNFGNESSNPVVVNDGTAPQF